MYIKKLRLNGYKRFKSLTIDLGNNPKRIIALVGPNGCGKSSVFDAILFYISAYGNNIGNKGQKDYRYHSISQNPTYNYKGVTIEFKEGSYEEVLIEKREKGNETHIDIITV